MTILSYNGVELRECETQVFDQEIVYDKSGTDKLFSRFRIRVASTMVRSPTYGGDNGHIESRSYSSGLDFVSKMRSIEEALSEPRRDFYYLTPDVEISQSYRRPAIIRATGSNEGQMWAIPPALKPEVAGAGFQNYLVNRAREIDLNSGPHPKHVSVKQMFGSNAARVEFEIEVCVNIPAANSEYQDADQWPDSVPTSSLIPIAPFYNLPADGDPKEPGGVTIRPVISNRWSMREIRDENWRIERRITGQLRVAHQSFFAHAMRYLCMPGLPDSFQRRSIMFTDDPTGLVLEYDILDVQREAAPPPPAVDWSCYHALSSTDTKQTIHQINVKLTGAYGVDKKELIEAAGWVVGQRIPGILRWNNDKDENGDDRPIEATLVDAALINIVTDPCIELRVTVRSTPKDATQLSLLVSKLAEPMPTKTLEGGAVKYSPKRWPVPLPFGTETPVGIFSCYLQNPLSKWHGIPKQFTYQPKGIPTALSYSRPPREDEPPPSSSHYRSEEPLKPLNDQQKYELSQLTEKPVTFVLLTNTYRGETGFVSLPRAIVPAPPDLEADPPEEYQDTCSFSQLHGGQCYRDFHMEITRIGSEPWIPEPTEKLTDINGIKERLIERNQVFRAPKFTHDGATRDYTVVCDYTYALSRFPSNTEKLRMATSPIDKITPTEALIDQETIYERTSSIEWREPPPTP